MSRALILDPRSERAAAAPLELFTEPSKGPGVYVRSQAWPDPEQDPRRAAAAEGDRRAGKPRLGNRRIPLELWIAGRRESYVGTLTQLLTNPGFEAATIGTAWESFTSSGDWTNPTPLERRSAWSDTGEYAGYVRLVKANTATASTWVVRQSVAQQSAAVPGETFYARILANILDAPATGIKLQLLAFTGAGAFISTFAESAAFETGAGERLLTLSGVTPATTAFVRMGIRIDSATANDVAELYLDSAKLSRDASPDYFDGDTPGSRWTGTAHASTSQQDGDADQHFEAIAEDLDDKLRQLRDEGGYISRPFKLGRLTFDVQGAEGDGGEHDGRRWAQRGQGRAVTLEALPFGRAQAIAAPLRGPAGAPVNVFSESGIEGNGDGLGSLEITDTSAATSRALIGGIEQADYDTTAATAALYYAAEALTPLDSSSLQTRSGAHGAGNNVIRSGAATGGWQSILSTKIAASSLHLTHVGLFRVLARVYAPTRTGDMRLRLAYGQGDLLAPEINDSVKVPAAGAFYLVDLGLVRIDKVKAGTQRWEGRIQVKSLSGDLVEIDDIRLVPVGFASLDVRAPLLGVPPSTYAARDEFEQAGGALNAKVLPQGGSWATSGGLGADYQVDGTNDWLDRTDAATADGSGANAGKVALAGVGTATDILASVDLASDKTVWVNGVTQQIGGPGGPINVAGAYTQALVIRYVDANNYVRLVYEKAGTSGAAELRLEIVTAGAVAATWRVNVSSLAAEVWATVRLAATATGFFAAWFASPGAALGSPVLAGHDTRLATAGSHASGRYGLYDQQDDISASRPERRYDNFAVWTPTSDAALYASRKARWMHDGYWREDSAGTLYSPKGNEGDPLLVPPATRERRTLRAIVMASTGDLEQLPDVSAVLINAQLTTTPRYASARG